MNVNRLVWELHLDVVACLFRLQSVVAGVTAGIYLYSISCNLVAFAHHFLAHIHYRHFSFFFSVLSLGSVVGVGVLLCVVGMGALLCVFMLRMRGRSILPLWVLSVLVLSVCWGLLW